MKIHNRIYAFHAIAQLSGSRIHPGQQVQSSLPWMLIGMSGSMIVHAGERQYTLAAGAALTGGPGGFAIEAAGAEDGWKLYWIAFSVIELADGPGGALITGKEADKQERYPEGLAGAAGTNGAAALAAAGLARTVRAAGAVASGYRYAWQASGLLALAEQLFHVAQMSPESECRYLASQKLIQEMMLWWLSGSGDEPAKPIANDQSIYAVLRYMERHFAEALTREQLAAQAGITDAYFSVRFKKLTGYSPSVYLERLRVHCAAELLLQTRGRKGDLADIARDAGFRDAWYMGKRFRAMLGSGPTQYRSSFIPQRVASLQYPYTNHLLALGIIPSAARFSTERRDSGSPATVAAMASLSVSVPAPASLAASESLSASAAAMVELPPLLSIERQQQLLLGNKPELILTYDTDSARERLRSVAPVVYIPWLSMSWREHLLMIARLLRKEQEATACIRRLEEQAAQAREQLHGKLAGVAAVSLFKIENRRCYLYGMRDAGCIFYEFLGFAPPPLMQQRLAQEPNLHSVEITIQQMAEHAGDLNIIIISPGEGEQRDFLRLDEHWRQFELAVGTRMLELDYREWLHYDPINIAVQLQQITAILLNWAKRC